MKNRLLTVLFLLVSLTASAQFSAVRINALGWATGTLNAGVDVAVSEKWSVDVAGYWNPINRANILAATVGVRRWRFEPHVGLFWGIHSAAARYKVGKSGNRYYGWTAGVGSSVGYSWMLARRWNFSIEGGLGVFYMQDRKLEPDTSPMEDIILKHHRRVVLAPSKIEVSFSYLF